MESVLRIQNLTVSYPAGVGKTKTAVDSLSLDIAANEIFGLLGPNGAGKTTLIKAVAGLMAAQRGEISLFGKSPPKLADRARTGFLPEISAYYWFFTPGELLGMYGSVCGMSGGGLKAGIDRAPGLVGLSAEKNHLIKTFSKGMQQRLGLAQALLHDPEFLILDEPVSGLDPLGRVQVREILQGLKKKNKTILLSSHELSEAELICDTICVMKDGRALRSGAMKELLGGKGALSLEQYFLDVIK